jgi:hypothetical protein
VRKIKKKEVINMTEKITARNVMELWAKNYPEVERWLNHLQKKGQNALALYNFCQWTHKTPQELLALKVKDPSANEVEKILDDFCASEVPSFTNALKYQASNSVKSFFKWNYRDLAKASGAVTLEKVKPYNALSKEGLRKLWFAALNPRDRALTTFTTSTGIAKETLTNLLWSHLEENWETKDLPCINIGSELLKGHGKGKYRGVMQITFLTPEAKRDLLNYKAWMESPQKLGRKLVPNDHIWLETCKPFRPLSYDSYGILILTLSRNAGVPFSWHDARRWVNTALEQIGISPNWARKIRGRKVKGEEAPYSQPAINQLKEKFREAVPILEFTSERPQVPKEIQERLAQMEAEQKALKQQYGIFRKARHIKTEVDEEEKCEDGEHCAAQRIVGEEDLANFLSENWKVAAVLPSGKVVIQRA